MRKTGWPKMKNRRGIRFFRKVDVFLQRNTIICDEKMSKQHMSTAFRAKVAAFMRQQCPIDIGKTQLVALSGGADSVALLLVLRELGYTVVAAHCNFELRGDESLRDEKFCKSLCERLGIALHVKHFDTKAYAQAQKISIEMAARDLRYAWFRELLAAIPAETICVAHHQEDNAETMLMNLVRGTGLRGLAGILPLTDGIARPLLSVTRSEIESYLKEVGQEYVTDSTNMHDDFARNKLRINVFPALSSINTAVVQNMNNTSRHLQDALRLLDATLDEALTRLLSTDGIDVESLLREPSPELLLFHWLYPLGFSSAQIEDVSVHLQAEDSLLWTSASHELLLSRGRLVVRPAMADEFGAVVIEDDGVYQLPNQHTLTVLRSIQSTSFQPSKQTCEVTLDAEKVSFPLTVRRAERGDRFVPFGMKGSKLVSDYLTDRKCSLFEKRAQLVVTDAEGRIVWLVNQRTDGRFCIDSKTEKVLLLSMKS